MHSEIFNRTKSLTMNSNRIEVKKLRLQFANKYCNIPTEPGVYRWWFPKEIAEKLLLPLECVDNKSIDKDDVNGEQYWCLYLGISKNLRQRIRWHIAQKHTRSAVDSGYLSTLRKTISALLDSKKNPMETEQAVNKVLDECYWDWETMPTHPEAKKKEKEILSENYLPLNIQDNKVVDYSVINKLKDLRREYKDRKNSYI